MKDEDEFSKDEVSKSGLFPPPREQLDDEAVSMDENKLSNAEQTGGPMAALLLLAVVRDACPVYHQERH